mgnify:FL=1
MADSLLIIEDEEGLALSLEDRFESEGYSVTIQHNGIHGEETARNERHDCIILDIMLPGRDGFQICQNLREEGITTPILMLTARDTNMDTVMGLRLGADDYLPKPFDMQVLLARVQALLRRKAEYGAPGSSGTAASSLPRQRSFGTFTLDTDLRQLRNEKDTTSLSSQEYRLMEYFTRNPDRVISRDELLDEVWGYGSSASTRTVDVHVARLRKKLGEEEEPVHIHTSRGHGYRFSPNPPVR